MPYNGVGVFTRIYSWVTDQASGVLVRADRMDTDTNDIATGLSNCMTRDGQSPPTAPIPMGSQKLTGLANGVAATDAVNYGQVFGAGGTFTSPIFLGTPDASGATAFLVPTAAAGDSTTKAASTAFVQSVAMTAALPNQTGNSGKFVTTDGSVASWGIPNIPIAAAAGTVDAITATYAPVISLADKMVCAVVCAGANTSTTPTFAPNGLTAHTITKNGGSALVASDLAGAGFVALLEYNLANTRWELLNPKAIPPTASLGASMTLLSTVTASNSATVDVETTFSSTYDAYMLVISGVRAASGGNALGALLKIGGSYAASNYLWVVTYSTDGAGPSRGSSASDTKIHFSQVNLDTAATGAANYVAYIHNPSSTALTKKIHWSGISYDGTNMAQVSGSAMNTGTSAMTGIRFLMDSGNITSGTFRLFGISNS